MNYPILIREIADKSYSLSAVDLAGCSVKANSIDDGLNQMRKVLGEHLEILAEYGENIPNAKLIDYYMKQNDNCTWALLDIDIIPYMGKSQKINVTLPELLIKKIDDRVSKSSQHKTRSGFIASVCLKELSNRDNN